MPDILYIVGTQRSGSTAFERFLASHAGTVAIGEARTVWSGRDWRGQVCSCRLPVLECPFWTSVLSHAYGPAGRPDGGPLRTVRENVDRPQYVPMMHHALVRTPRFRSTLPVAHDLIGRFYRAVADAAPGRLIIESTKVPWFGHLLSTVPGLRVAFVHLVRDSRAVVHSELRKRPGSALKAALRWDANFAFSLALTPYVKERLVRVRYEDFARDPDVAAGRVQRLLQRSEMAPLGNRHDDADPNWYHVAVGNRMRYTDDFVIRADEEWRTALTRGRRLLVGAATLPFLALSRRRLP